MASPKLLDDQLVKDDPKKVIYKNKVKPQHLLSSDAKDKDPHDLYAAVLMLVEEKKPVSAEAVLGALDKDGDSWKAQSTEDRQRRAEYLEAELDADSDFAATADAIIHRQKLIDYNVNFWGGITSLMFNIGAFFGHICL